MLFKSIILSVLCFPFLIFSQEVDRKDPNYKAFFYKDGKMSSEGLLIDGKPDGYWITYYQNELRKSEGNRLNFLLDGIWTFYDEEGNITETITYLEGEKSGCSMTYENCHLKREQMFEKGIQIDVEREFYPDSSDSIVRYEIPFKAGKMDGTAYFYGRDGRVVEIVTYKKGFVAAREKINQKDENGMKQGIWKEYFDNGRLKTERRYKDDELNGYVKNYNVDGKLEEAELYLSNEKQSEEENQADFDILYTYYDDGSIESATTYNLAGMKDGVAQYFDREGNVIMAEIYKDDYLISKGIIDKSGIKRGDWENYYLNGNIKSKGKYKNGLRYGKWVFYYSTGQKEQEGTYDNAGLYTSEWNWYYENGNILRTEEFLRGKEDGMLIEFDIDSNIITKGEFLEGEKEGEWYYSLNDHSEYGKYLYGERNGYWEFKYPNGKISFEGVFESGRPHGKHKYYNLSGILIKEEIYSYGVREGKWKWFDDSGVEYLTIVYKRGEEKKVNGAKFK